MCAAAERDLGRRQVPGATSSSRSSGMNMGPWRYEDELGSKSRWRERMWRVRPGLGLA